MIRMPSAKELIQELTVDRSMPVSTTGSGSPQCGQVSALGETVLPQTLHGFIPSGIATR